MAKWSPYARHFNGLRWHTFFYSRALSNIFIPFTPHSALLRRESNYAGCYWGCAHFRWDSDGRLESLRKVAMIKDLNYPVQHFKLINLTERTQCYVQIGTCKHFGCIDLLCHARYPISPCHQSCTPSVAGGGIDMFDALILYDRLLRKGTDAHRIHACCFGRGGNSAMPRSTPSCTYKSFDSSVTITAVSLIHSRASLSAPSCTYIFLIRQCLQPFVVLQSFDSARMLLRVARKFVFEFLNVSVTRVFKIALMVRVLGRGSRDTHQVAAANRCHQSEMPPYAASSECLQSPAPSSCCPQVQACRGRSQEYVWRRCKAAERGRRASGGG